MKLVLVTLSILVLSACSMAPFQTTAIGNGHYKVLTDGDSKNKAFIFAISAMRAKCGYDGVLYEIVEQTVEGNEGRVAYSKATKEDSYAVNSLFYVLKKQNQIFKGYDMTTIFKCTGQKV